jgi:superfamily II DNA/RNA helicase
LNNFELLGLAGPIVSALASSGITKPTPIQAQAIPPALEGKDILGSAQTGTGKTAAFCIPLITNLINSNRGSSLVMTPTRELATQVSVQLKKILVNYPQLKIALLIGGEPMPRQLSQLRNRPRIVVGTPGRINDHLNRGSLMLHDANFLVLDETDRMLDMGFSDQLDSIVKYLPVKRQTLLFSATIPKEIEKIANKYLNAPVRIAIDAKQLTVEKIKQDVIFTTENKKYEEFLSEIENRNGSIVVFMKTKFSTEKMATKLKGEGYKAAAINGDLRQHKRDRVLDNFRNKRSRILVATDVAARGLDIPHIEHVINYDLPQCPEDYVHRIGRTGRAGA